MQPRQLWRFLDDAKMDQWYLYKQDSKQVGSIRCASYVNSPERASRSLACQLPSHPSPPPPHSLQEHDQKTVTN